MPRVGDASSRYQQLPVESRNVVDIDLGSSLKLRDLLEQLKATTGNETAELRGHLDYQQQGDKTLRILVPSSPGSVPSLWTRFKAALSHLPLLNRSATLQAARMEASAQPLSAGVSDTMLRHGVMAAIRNELGDKMADLLHTHFMEDRGGGQGAMPLTKRNVVRVLHAAVGALDVRAQRAQEDMERSRAEAREHARIAKTAAWEPSAGPDKPAVEPKRVARNQPAPKMGLDDALAPLKGARHGKLFSFCVDLVKREHGESIPVDQIAHQAARLHDRVEARLAIDAQWPIGDDEDDFANDVKPLAEVMSEASGDGLGGRDVGTFLACVKLAAKQSGTSNPMELRNEALKLYDELQHMPQREGSSALPKNVLQDDAALRQHIRDFVASREVDD